MSKKPILSRHAKKLIALILVCLITISLTGCDTSNKMPSGGLGNLNATYASTTVNINGVSTKLETSVEKVYNKIRYNAVDYVENEVYKYIYQDEIAEVTANPSKYDEEFRHSILHDVYEVHHEEDLEDLSIDKKKIAEEKYLDKMYQKGYVISTEQISKGDFTSVYPHYYLEVAKHIAAKNALIEEVSKDLTFVDGNIQVELNALNDETYFTSEDVVTYYENNYEKTGNVDSILIRFVSIDEAKNVLKKFGLKESGGKFYQIPLDENKVKTEKDYNDYYSKYSIKTTGDNALVSIDAQGMGRATVLKVYAAIYNYIYTFRNPIGAEVVQPFAKTEGKDEHLQYYYYIQNIVKNDQDAKEAAILAGTYNAEKVYSDLVTTLTTPDANNPSKDYVKYITMDKERLDKYSTSLSNYLYNTLRTEPAEEGKSFTQYLASAKSYGSYYYLLFKLNEHPNDDEVEMKLYEEKTVDGETVIEFKNQAFLNKILKEMLDEKINDAFVEEKFNERVKDAKLRIYDSIVETQFMYSSSSPLVENYEKNKKKSNDLIAEVTYKDQEPRKISVAEAFGYLEPLYGPQLASNLLFQEYIKKTTYYTDIAKDSEAYDNYVETVKLMLYYFANDYYASSGYPSTIGKYNFMMLYYGTANVDEVVKDFLMVSDAINAFYADFAAHGFTGDSEAKDFYKNLQASYNEAYDKFYSLTLSGLTVYYDQDEDGEADEVDYKTLIDFDSDKDGVLDSNAATKLLEKAYDAAINSHTDYATALNNVVAEYKKSSRIDNENPTSAEANWADFRSKGLYLEVSSFGTITDSSTDADDKVQERAEKLYKLMMTDRKLGFTTPMFDQQYASLKEEGPIATEDHKLSYLLATAGTFQTSAKFESEDDVYNKINVVIQDQKHTIDMNYADDKITVEQIKVYVAEYILLGDVYSLPSTTIAALDEYILPLITKYTGSANQQLITGSVLGTITFEDNGYTLDAFSDEYKAAYANRNSFLNKYNEILRKSEDGYLDTYNSWWQNMKNVFEGGAN